MNLKNTPTYCIFLKYFIIICLKDSYHKLFVPLSMTIFASPTVLFLLNFLLNIETTAFYKTRKNSSPHEPVIVFCCGYKSFELAECTFDLRLRPSQMDSGHLISLISSSSSFCKSSDLLSRFLF